MKNRKFIIKSTFVLAGLLAVGLGCTAIQSTRHADSKAAGSGLAYYLPKGSLRLLVIQEVVSSASDPAPAQPAPAQPAPAQPAPAQPAPAQPAPAQPAPAQPAPAQPAPAQPAPAQPAPAQPAPAQPAPAQPAPAQPAVSGKIIKPLLTNCFVSVDVELTPDRSARYLLQMTPKFTADDYMKFRVNNGLLETVTLTNSDQTIGVLNNLVLAAIEFYKFTALGGFTAAGAGEVLITNRTTNVFLIDPFSLAQRTKLSTDVKTDYGVTLDFSDFEKSVENSVLVSAAPASTAGIFYRPLERYQFSWKSSGGSGAGSVYFPNAAPILSMEVKRAAFVSQSYVLSLQQGVPVEVMLNKPSQALALSAFPLNVARALVSLPTNLIQLKIDYSSKSSELLKAKDAQITNLIHLLETQKKFEAFQATNSAGTNQTKSGKGS